MNAATDKESPAVETDSSFLACDAPSKPTTRDERAGSLWITISLVIILVLAGTLRFSGITKVGIRYDDESWYVSDARLWHRCMRVVTDQKAVDAVLDRDKQAFRDRLNELGVDFSYRYLKPCQGYTGLGALTMFVVGDRPAALLVLNALCATLSVWILYGIGATLFNRGVGLGAAFLLGVSPYHVVYARSAMADSTVVMFLLIAVLCWALGTRGYRRWGWAYLMAGLAAGFAVICHYRAAYFSAALLLGDWLWVRRGGISGTNGRRALPGFVGRHLVLVLGMCVPALVLEFVFQAARLAARVSDSYLPVPTYLQAGWKYWLILRERIVIEGGSRWNADALGAYWDYLTHWHGAALTILSVVGLVVMLRAKGSAKWPAFFVMVTLGILLTQRYTVARALSLVVPFLCLSAAVILGAMCAVISNTSRRCAKPLVVLGFVGITALVSLPALKGSLELRDKHSGIGSTQRFLIDHKARSVTVPMDPKKYALYFEGTGVELISADQWRYELSPAEVLVQLRELGVRWVVTDPQHWHCRDPRRPVHFVFDWWEKMQSFLDEEATLAAEFSHIEEYRWEFLAEGWGLSHLQEMIEKSAGPIRIYDLQAGLFDTSADAVSIIP